MDVLKVTMFCFFLVLSACRTSDGNNTLTDEDDLAGICRSNDAPLSEGISEDERERVLTQCKKLEQLFLPLKDAMYIPEAHIDDNNIRAYPCRLHADIEPTRYANQVRVNLSLFGSADGISKDPDWSLCGKVISFVVDFYYQEIQSVEIQGWVLNLQRVENQIILDAKSPKGAQTTIRYFPHGKYFDYDIDFGTARRITKNVDQKIATLLEKGFEFQCECRANCYGNSNATLFRPDYKQSGGGGYQHFITSQKLPDKKSCKGYCSASDTKLLSGRYFNCQSDDYNEFLRLKKNVGT